MVAAKQTESSKHLLDRMVHEHTSNFVSTGFIFLSEGDRGRLSEIVENACGSACAERFANPGDTIVITGGMPFGVSGSTNLLRIAKLPLQHAGG